MIDKVVGGTNTTLKIDGPFYQIIISGLFSDQRMALYFGQKKSPAKAGRSHHIQHHFLLILIIASIISFVFSSRLGYSLIILASRLSGLGFSIGSGEYFN